MAISLSANADTIKVQTLEPVSYSSGQERGAGSGLAAEFYKAMDEFIEIVKNNKSYFRVRFAVLMLLCAYHPLPKH